MLCQRCQAENPPGARFCSACGAALADSQVTDQSEPPRPGADALADAGLRLGASGGPLAGERRLVTVLFADLSGFTAMSEKLDPEEIVLILNTCFQALVEVVTHYDGFVDKFIGDEVMALFGAPRAHDNDADRAVRAALEMRDAISRVNATPPVPLPTPLTIHVGINTGEVVAGGVGSDRRMDYSVIGDTVNLAARLADVAVAGQILVTERTRALSHSAGSFRPLAPLQVQGKARPIQAYEVLAAAPAVLVAPPLGSPFIGRARELLITQSAAAEASTGSAQVIGISGDAGVGKSRVLAELIRATDGFEVVQASCSPFGTPPAYQLIAGVCRELLHLAPEASEATIMDTIQSWATAAQVSTETAAFLASVLGIHDERLPLLSDATRQARVCDAVRALLTHASARAPLLLGLEDLQWIDGSSRILLDALLPQLTSTRLLIACTYRPEFAHPWQETTSYHSIALEPLPNQDAIALARAILGLDPPPGIERLILSHCDGNPFFVEEMLKALKDEGVIRQVGGRTEIVGDLTELTLPDTIQGVILARIDRLEARVRETLQYAAVIGRRFPHELLRAVAPGSERLDDDVKRLEELELILPYAVDPELEYLFKHFVTQNVAYSTILARRRRAIHLEVARHVETLYRERLADFYELLAHHYAAGEEWDQAAHYFELAGRKASDLHSDTAATAFFDQRDEAVRQLSEQREEGSWRRLGEVAALVLFLTPVALFWVGALRSLWEVVSSVPDGIDRFGYFEAILPQLLTFTGFELAFTALIIRGFFLIARSKSADSVAVYTNRVIISSRRGGVEVPFHAITAVLWDSQPGNWYWLREGWLRLIGRSRVIYGAPRALGDPRADSRRSRLVLAQSDAPPLTIISANSGALYRGLRSAVRRWEALGGIGSIRELGGRHSALEDQDMLALRQEDGTPLNPLGYQTLLDRVAEGALVATDQVSVEDGSEQRWLSLEDAADHDWYLYAAFHPYRAQLRRAGRSPFLLLLLLWLPAAPVGGGLFWALMFCFTLFPLILAAHLRLGFLGWARRYRLPPRQWMQLRITTTFTLGIVMLLLGEAVFAADARAGLPALGGLAFVMVVVCAAALVLLVVTEAYAAVAPRAATAPPQVRLLAPALLVTTAGLFAVLPLIFPQGNSPGWVLPTWTTSYLVTIGLGWLYEAQAWRWVKARLALAAYRGAWALLSLSVAAATILSLQPGLEPGAAPSPTFISLMLILPIAVGLLVILVGETWRMAAGWGKVGRRVAAAALGGACGVVVGIPFAYPQGPPTVAQVLWTIVLPATVRGVMLVGSARWGASPHHGSRARPPADGAEARDDRASQSGTTGPSAWMTEDKWGRRLAPTAVAVTLFSAGLAIWIGATEYMNWTTMPLTNPLTKDTILNVWEAAGNQPRPFVERRQLTFAFKHSGDREATIRARWDFEDSGLVARMEGPFPEQSAPSPVVYHQTTSAFGRVTDLALETTVRATLSPLQTLYGIELAPTQDLSSIYRFTVTPGTRAYSVTLVEGERQRLLVAGTTAALQSGSGENALRMEVRGQSLLLFVNGQPVDSISDPGLGTARGAAAGFYQAGVVWGMSGEPEDGAIAATFTRLAAYGLASKAE